MIINLPIGIVGSNCIVLFDDATKIGAVIDPGILDAGPVKTVIDQHAVQIAYILNTHGHFDHTAGNGLLHHQPVKLALHPADRDLLLAGGGAALFGLDYPTSPEPDMALEDNAVLTLGELDVRALHTPGHTPGCVSFYIEKVNTVITGDTLFQGSVGRTDLPGGDEQVLLHSLKSYLTLPDETIVMPGHGPSSSLREERIRNPWLRYVIHHETI
ncbi:MAG: MBL fold metallo-hydrolase [Anaerolineae bacterium]|nr:MBL fold metallo-hydrolase [Anaerolineae bacterium]